MFTQEEYMDVLGMRSQGWTIAEIARATNYHPATVSKWLKNGGPPPKRSADPASLVVDRRWGSRIGELIEPPSRLLSTSVFEIITAEGFGWLLSVGGPEGSRTPRPPLPTCTPGIGAHRDGPGRGVPVRLFGLLGTRTGLWPG